MNFIVKKVPKAVFYPIYGNWCEQHGFPVITGLWLPENSFVCFNDKSEPIYGIWFYHSDSKLAHIGFPISNKAIPFEQRQGGLEFLLEYVIKYAKKKKYVSVFTTSDTDAIIKTLDSKGFVLGDKGVNHYFKIL